MRSYPTVRRYMQAHGMLRKRRARVKGRPGEIEAAKRREQREIRSYEAEYVGSLWHSDFHHGRLKVLTPGGRWQPMTDAELCFRRALSARKPYCFLMNTHYADFTLELTERYMQRALAYGMFPGFFSENASTDCYFTKPEWYEPARPLFKKYIPLIRTIARAGWQPVTRAASGDPAVLLERFGEPGDGTVYLTALNDSPEPRTAHITVDLAALGWDTPPRVTEMLSGADTAPGDNATIPLALAPEQAVLLRFTR